MDIDEIIESLVTKPLDKADRGEIIDQLLSLPIDSRLFTENLPPFISDQLVSLLKEQADKHWHIDPQISLRCAEKIITMGTAQRQPLWVALGKMALGDALKFIGNTQQAWDSLEEAGELFLEHADEFGWARTCIGKLWLSTELGSTEHALEDAEKAEAIFAKQVNQRMLMRLHWNMAAVHNHLGNYHRALDLYQTACDEAQSLGSDGEASLGYLYSNMGFSHLYLGNLGEAEQYYEQARNRHIAHDEKRALAIENCNLAKVAQIRGKYQPALDLLYKVERLEASGLDDVKTFARRQIAECYLALNRYEDARRIALEVIEQFDIQGMEYRGVALALICLAEAEVRLGNYEDAQNVLARAEQIYAAQGAEGWAAVLKIKRGQIASARGDADLIQHEISAAIPWFEANGRNADLAEAKLLLAQAYVMTEDFTAAQAIAETVLAEVREKGISDLEYRASILLGTISEKCQRFQQAIGHYQAAATIIERTQGHLMMTLHQGFLQRKNEAFHATIQLYIRHGQVKQALNALERMKAQVILDWFTNRELLRWRQDDYSRQLLNELKDLKAQHHWYYQKLYTQVGEDGVFPKSGEVLPKLAALEEKISHLVEELHVYNHLAEAKNLDTYVSIVDIQKTLPEATAVIEFYANADQVWAFVLAKDGLLLQVLPVAMATIDRHMQQLLNHINRALSFPTGVPIPPSFVKLFCRLSAQLNDVLIKPIEGHLNRFKQLIFVPYGSLHQLPFNLLYNGTEYLIENFEIIIEPTAAFITHSTPPRNSGGCVLAYSWNDRIPDVLSEANIVAQLLNDPVYCNLDAKLSDLHQSPTQILHLAAHGEYRIDHPEFSYIQLADGQLMMDDLLQQDLSYELVTLSCCETGQAYLTPADESLGLGFGFLYAGAGALIVSLWRIHDIFTVDLMKYLYQSMMEGRSKADALRRTQCMLLHEHPELHPAYWGAFQLIGSPAPLSVSATANN